MNTKQGSTERKRLNESERRTVYNIFDGHCAYCGCSLSFDELQVDHILPVARFEDANTMENYFPSCKECNLLKSSRGLEAMRKRIERIHSKLSTNFQYTIAKKYGMIEETPHRVKFYFEEHQKNKLKE